MKLEIEKIDPAFPANYIAIAMSSSKEYVPYLSVCLQSLQEHISKDKNYDIVIFERNITDQDKAILKRQIEQKNISLRFYNPASLVENYQLKFPPHYNLECYFRLVAPLVFRSYKKIIFTDVDLLFNADVAELYSINLEGKPLGAVQDYIWGIFVNNPNWDWREYAQNVLMLENLYKYFNTGVMLLNVEEFNNNSYSKKLLDLVSHTQFRILEQDGLNKFFQSNIKYLPSSWNFPTLNSIYKSTVDLMPDEFAVKYQKDRLNPKIIHFAGGEKPWDYLENEFADIWWKYARESPFYEILLDRIVQKEAALLEVKMQDQIASLELKIQDQIASLISQLTANIKTLVEYPQNLLRYYKYRILFNFVWGKKRARYECKKQFYKQKVISARRLLREN